MGPVRLGRNDPDPAVITAVTSAAFTLAALADRAIVMLLASDRFSPLFLRDTLILIAGLVILQLGAGLTRPGTASSLIIVLLHGMFAAMLTVSHASVGIFPGLLAIMVHVLHTRLVRPAWVAATVTSLWFLLVASLTGFQTVWDAPPPSGISETLRHTAYILGFITAWSVILSQSLHRQSRSKARIASLEGAVHELTAANMSYNTFIQMAESQAARHERDRITREIHDGVGYALTNLIMLAESAQDSIPMDTSRTRAQLSIIRNQARLALADTRRALRELRFAEQGLVYGEDALHHMLDTFQQATGVRTHREFHVGHALLENARTFPVIYRFVQESLTNSFRHGNASEVTVHIWSVDDRMVVSVQDNGSGNANISEGIGIQGMRERLGEIGGDVTYHSLDGFTVIADIPAKPEEVDFV